MKLEVCVHVPGLSPRLLYLCAFRSTSAYRRSKNGRIALTNDVRVSATSVICRDACLSPMGTVPQSSLQPPEQLRRVYNLSVIIHVLYCVYTNACGTVPVNRSRVCVVRVVRVYELVRRYNPYSLIQKHGLRVFTLPHIWY